MPLAYSVRRLIPLVAVIICMLSPPWVVSNAGGSNDYAESFTTKPGTATSQPRSSIKTSISHHSVQITMEDAIVLALKNNRSLRVERLNPSIRQTFEDEVRAAFDPTFNGGADFSRGKEQERAKNSPAVSDNTSNEGNLAVGVSQFFSTGTDVNVDLSTKRDWSDDYRDQHASRVGLSVTQALLRGRGTDVNLADLRQAQLDTRASQYELHGFVEALVFQVKQAYWDYALAQRRIEIFQESLNLADQQLRETEEIIKVGKLAETEVTAAQAEIALRRRDLIDARSTMETTRLRLLRLLNLPGTEPLKLEVTLLSYPEIPKVKLDPVEAHVESALRLRSDLNQAQLGIQRNELDVVKTKNGLLPKMDFFITLGKTGYADSFGTSISNVTEDYYDISSGIRFEYPFRNRESEARYRRSLLRRDQADNAMENLAQLVELDVRSAFIEVNRAQEQISATAVSRGLQEEKLRIETEKFRVGRSTMFLVAQAQRDLVFSRIAEVEAVINYLKALIDFYRLEGTLLTRHNISTFNGVE